VDAEVRQEMRSIDRLARQDFLITDEGKPQEILSFRQIEEPLDRILLFDTSGLPRDSQDGNRRRDVRRGRSDRAVTASAPTHEQQSHAPRSLRKPVQEPRLFAGE
jgi:hypothetical protein